MFHFDSTVSCTTCYDMMDKIRKTLHLNHDVQHYVEKKSCFVEAIYETFRMLSMLSIFLQGGIKINYITK